MAVFKLRGAVKNYEWGKKGIKSAVAALQNSDHKTFIVDEETPYAELWLGTHESGPSTIPSLDDKKLLQWLNENVETLGENITLNFGTSVGLPFLFKVLSVNKALSIQAHPDKELAVKLHQSFPQYYPDDNHKPELAIALNKFEALCGFRPIPEIKSFLQEIQELQDIIGVHLADEFMNSCGECKILQSVFTALMTSTPVFQEKLSCIIDNFKQNKYTSNLASSLKDILLKTYDQYPGDIGCLCFFFLNYMHLKAGEAVFLAANEPHAYLYGDCIECMACSDNVVRAGLTPKYRDVNILCNMLTYHCKAGDENKFPALTNPTDIYVKTYNPPVKEFSVDSISLPVEIGLYGLKSLKSASVLLVIEGDGIFEFKKEKIRLNYGTTLFISSDTLVSITPSSKMLMFRAYCDG